MGSERSSNQTEIHVVASNQDYLVQPRGGELFIGRKAEGTILWQDESVPIADLTEGARAALEEGRTDSSELTLALESIVQAFIQRGG